MVSKKYSHFKRFMIYHKDKIFRKLLLEWVFDITGATLRNWLKQLEKDGVSVDTFRTDETLISVGIRFVDLIRDYLKRKNQLKIIKPYGIEIRNPYNFDLENPLDVSLYYKISALYSYAGCVRGFKQVKTLFYEYMFLGNGK